MLVHKLEIGLWLKMLTTTICLIYYLFNYLDTRIIKNYGGLHQNNRKMIAKLKPFSHIDNWGEHCAEVLSDMLYKRAHRIKFR